MESVNDKLIDASNGCFDLTKDKKIDSSESSFSGLEDHESSECIIFPKDKVILYLVSVAAYLSDWGLVYCQNVISLMVHKLKHFKF